MKMSVIRCHVLMESDVFLFKTNVNVVNVKTHVLTTNVMKDNCVLSKSRQKWLGNLFLFADSLISLGSVLN